MIIRREDIQDVCTKILSAVDSNELSVLTETLELQVKNQTLYMSVTNREYYAQVKLFIGEDIDFHATVNANLFLKLISQITTDTIELNINNTNMVVKGNGTYKLPLIYDGDKLLELPEIVINNVTANFDINSDILLSILNYNSKELNKGTIVKPVQKMYYVDEQGAITFTSGACVNNFTLAQPIKILLNSRIVKLFKLFKAGSVKFSLGYDALSEEIIQTKVKFENEDISLTAILSCDDAMLTSVPVSSIRNLATAVYPNSITINKSELIQTINRLLLFTSNGKDTLKPYGTFEFTKDKVTVYGVTKDNKEDIFYKNELANDVSYTAILDLTDIRATLENCTEQYLTVNFGDTRAVVVARGNVYNVIPEIHSV